MRFKEIYKKLSEQHNIPVEIVQKACESQFAFTKEIISSPEDGRVRLQSLGQFVVKPNRRENLRKKREILKKIRDDKRKNKQEE